MLSVVLITPRYLETGAAAGLYAGMLGQALADRGHRVHVVTAMSPAAMPRHDCHGATTVHRLELRRGSPAQAFVVAACRLARELRRTGDCDVVECIDCPDCVAGLGLLREPDAESPTLVSALVDPACCACALAPDAHTLASVSIVTDARHMRPGDTAVVPPPLLDRFWHPPEIDGPALVLCDASDPRAEALVMNAFKGSEARRLGWSLAFRGPEGRWVIIGGERAPDGPRRQVLITTNEAAPIAPMLALGHDAMSVVPAESGLNADADQPWPLTFGSNDPVSLRAVIDDVAPRSPSELSTLAQIWHQRLAPAHDPGSIAMLHEEAWAQARGKPAGLPASRLWRSIESGLTASMGGV